jgi:hypothetical protein
MKKIYSLFLLAACLCGTGNAQVLIPVENELILPQYAYYGGTSASPINRLPFVCRLKLTGLEAGATYRYQAGLSTVSNLTNPPAANQQAPGPMYRINNGQNVIYGHITGYSANKSMAGSEIQNDMMYTQFSLSYNGRFTADGSGSYTGWFGVVAIGNTTHHINGGNAYMYVQLSNPNGSTFTTSHRTTSTVKLLNYSSAAGDPAGCTALLGTSTVGDEKMVAIYDNTAGTGRPLYCTFTENNNTTTSDPVGQLTEGTIWSNPEIYPKVDGISGSWAAIVPNNLPGGVKAINFHNIQDASLILPTPNISNDGSWNGVSTVNPAGDSTRPIVINSIAGSGLPVNLLSFRGQSAKEGVRLFWETSQEVNNRKFEINRASDDGIFRNIGVVEAVAVQATLNRYQFVDPNPVSGMNYYQLKQVDLDGRSTTYKTIAIRVGNASNAMYMTQSGSTELVVSINVSDNRKGSVVYTDMSGTVRYNQPVTLREGENMVRIPVAAGASKIAVVSFVAENGERMNLKVLRQ